MSSVDEIFSEFRRMRQSGVNFDESLRVLRNSVRPLARIEREQLARLIRAWEKGHQHFQDEPVNDSVNEPINDPIKDDTASRKPIKSLKPLEPPTTFVPLEEAVEQDDALWITCGNCGKVNRTSTVFCYSCGYMLGDEAKGKLETRKFADADAPSAHYFGAESVLSLKPRNQNVEIEIRPQTSDHEQVIGRVTDNLAVAPDIDLSMYDAGELGVSRLHLAVQYAAEDETILVHDLGSVNGTFINGQKLHPREQRILRDSDELRLGRMVIHVKFLHPGEQVS